MCLAVPARIESIDGDSAVVNIGGVERETSLVLVSGAQVGDFVLLHAGFAIQVVDPVEAAETLRLLEELAAAGEAPQGTEPGEAGR
jgi:hydrogenase expression/formation protein HypC